MSKEKQIEEMAKIASKCMTKWLNNETPKALPDYIAEALYNAGCRKQSEGEWAREFYPYRVFCSKCKTEARADRDGYYSTSTFCPDCGAKMKGGE